MAPGPIPPGPMAPGPIPPGPMTPGPIPPGPMTPGPIPPGSVGSVPPGPIQPGPVPPGPIPPGPVTPAPMTPGAAPARADLDRLPSPPRSAAPPGPPVPPASGGGNRYSTPDLVRPGVADPSRPAGTRPGPSDTGATPTGGRPAADRAGAAPTADPAPVAATDTPAEPRDRPSRRRRRADATPARSRTPRTGDEARRIDETLTRLTAAHAGVTLAQTDADAPAPTPERSRVRPGVGPLLIAVVALAVFAVTAFQYVGKARLDAAVTQVTALDPGSGAIIDAAGQAGDENVLIVGTDRSATAGGQRTDTVLLTHVPADGGDVVGVSVPYDLEVNRPPCREWDAATRSYLDGTVPAQVRTPLSSAFELGGPQCVTRVVQELTGLAVTRYVGVDLDGIGELVDAVGGVQVCVEQPVIDGLLGAVVPEPGPTTLDGRQARDFVAARTVEGDPGGGRGVLERQQRLVAALLEKTLSREVLLDPGRTGSLRPALGDALSADDADLDRILAAARSVRSFGAEGVRFVPVPTASGTSSQGNTLLRDADAAALFEALREGTELPDPTVLAAGAGPAPADVTVEILNASDRQGLAAEVGGTLGTLGFGVGEIGNAPEQAPETLIRFSPDRAADAELLARTVPSATSAPDPGASGVLQLVLGRSFDGVVRAPTAATPASASATPPATCA
ncbi:LCP family glycopolymer transferase [Pseudonocardia saturnea]